MRNYILSNVVMLAVGLFATAEGAAGSQVLGGNDVVTRGHVDTATGALFFDLNNPIATAGTVDSWRIFAANGGGVGQVELEIYRPGSTSWSFVGASPLSTVSWGGVNTFELTTPIEVQPGDLIGWWYPQGTVPAIVFDTPEGATLNNHDWPWDAIPETHTDLPNLFTTSWHGEWDSNARTYSIQVLGVPEAGSLGLLVVGGVVMLRRRK